MQATQILKGNCKFGSVDNIIRFGNFYLNWFSSIAELKYFFYPNKFDVWGNNWGKDLFDLQI